ncbi:Phosphoribosyl-AMP cyclohydrolase [Novosphingobium sp. CECT 9465]|nr:Phosphoribosyl-AMP cyclohydrolase [Novosphingobium sp. CECT 9465]
MTNVSGVRVFRDSDGPPTISPFPSPTGQVFHAALSACCRWPAGPSCMSLNIGAYALPCGCSVCDSLKPHRLNRSFTLSAEVDCFTIVDFAAYCGYHATRSAVSQAQGKADNPLSNTQETARREQGTEFMPKFDGNGLLTAVAIDHRNGALLMLAHMNAEAFAKTRETGFAHFHSRSRGKLWMKGESSGHVLKVIEIRVDCDQDAVELRVEPAGPACHTLAATCFYRRIADDGTLERIID